MESSELLRQAGKERSELARGLTVPRGYDLTLGAGVAALVTVVAVSRAIEAWWAALLLAAVALVFGVAGALQVRRFRELNGAWVSGLRSGRTRVATAVAVVAITAGFLGAIVAAGAGRWLLVAAIAAASGLAYGGASRWWMYIYRSEHGADGA